MGEQIAELRGEIREGFARQEGQLALLVQRGDQVDRQLTDHEARLDALERSRWPVPSVVAVTGLAALGVSAWALLGR
ncbi:hypothetical protein ACWD4V_13775 [Streptomyces tsukubensis]